MASAGIGFGTWVTVCGGGVLVMVGGRKTPPGRTSPESSSYQQIAIHPKILLLVSNPAADFSRGIADILQNWGYSVTPVSGAREAKRQLQTVSYDLAIFDLCDSEFGVRTDDLLKLHNRILFFVWDDVPSDLPLSSPTVAKPVSLEELSRKLREMLEGAVR